MLASLPGTCPVFQYGEANNERLDAGPANEATFVYHVRQKYTDIYRVLCLQLWPVISSVCTTYQADQRIIERTCRYVQTDRLISCFSCVTIFKVQSVTATAYHTILLYRARAPKDGRLE